MEQDIKTQKQTKRIFFLKSKDLRSMWIAGGGSGRLANHSTGNTKSILLHLYTTV